jgi:chromosome segregation ATPase
MKWQKRLKNQNKKRKELEDKKYDLSQTLLEFEKYKKDDDEREKKIENDIENIKSEYEFLQKNYDEVSKKNINLNKEIQQRNNEIEEKRKKINELRGVIGKLTEVRVILNKYFSSHFEHFTAQEKEIIKSVNNYKMTNPDKYNKAMNQLLETNEYGLGNYDDKRMINNNINTSSENNMIDNMPKITDVNKSLEMSGIGGEDQK